MRRPAGRCAMRTTAIGRMGSGSIHPCGCAIVVERSDVEIPIGENHRRIALWLSEVE
jgi:hypothetical protein